MSDSFHDLLDQLVRDPWRENVGYSEEIQAANRLLFDPNIDPVPPLSAWLQKHQPCLFGRIAAKLGLERYCILREADLVDDKNVHDKIQSARRLWTRDGYDGGASGFVILLISERVATAIPDETVFKLAKRLASLYLLQDVRADTIHLEEICLEKPGPARTTWRWLAGVNYFCAQGDKRWWHDHRIPGGLAFSSNSVGHMAKSGKITDAMSRLSEELGTDADEFAEGKIRTLPDALKAAMVTINSAQDTVSGPATFLLPLGDSADADMLKCPIELPSVLSGKNHCTYKGWYHTDYTLPRLYFRPDVTRPSDISTHDLDFTYLFHDDIANPDYETMGAGVQIRAEGADDVQKRRSSKIERFVGREIKIDECPRLKSILSE